MSGQSEREALAEPLSVRSAYLFMMESFFKYHEAFLSNTLKSEHTDGQK